MEQFEFRNPYAAPNAAMDLPPRSSYSRREPDKAGRIARLLANLADAAAYFVAMLPMLIAAGLYNRRAPLEPAVAGLVLLSLVAIVGLVIYNLYCLHGEGQTLGKRWVGVRIVRTDGTRASLPRLLFLRGFVPGLIGGIPYLGIFFVLANALWIFGEEKRCLHDHFADTIVVTA